MSPERLEQIRKLYEAAQEDPAALNDAEPGLRREVESLLGQQGSLPDLGVLKTQTHPALGTTFGPYRIQEFVGSGGLGQVFRAVDTRLGRNVALKITAGVFSGRFEREARAISSLNHPHICTLHDVGPNYLVMEFIEGESLSAVLKRGTLNIERVLEYGIHIAGALAAAHAKGITHRDLKPGNIMITKSGVKVLDFGLAKIRSTAEEPLTENSAVMGTPAYMAPEQLEGKPCDARTDIYALGLVLYEMATGKRRAQDDRAVLDGTPPRFAHIVQRCLEKDADARWQAASDIQAELAWAAPARAGALPEPGSRTSRRKWAAVLFSAGALVIAALVLAIGKPWRSTPAPRPMQFEIPVPDQARNPKDLRVSPDGRYFAFTAIGPNGSARRLWLHAVGSPEAKLLPDIDGAVSPFWSPDSRFVAVFTPNKLIRVDVGGGPPQTVCECTGTAGSWNQQGVILFGDQEGRLIRVPAGGGVPVAVSKSVMQFPDFLPDGRHFLYLSSPDRIGVSSLIGNQATAGRELASAPFAPAYAPPSGSEPGYLLFYRDETLLAQPFDARRTEAIGDPISLAQHLQMAGNAAAFTVSANNVLLYRIGVTAGDTQLTWFNNQGKPLQTVGEPESHLTLALSPDGSQVAFARLESRTNLDSNLWLMDASRGNTTRFTSGTGSLIDEVWSPDGRDLAYSVRREGRDLVYRKAVSGDAEELLLKSERAVPNSWSPDNRFLLYQSYTTTTSTDLWLLPLAAPHRQSRYLTSDFPENDGRFSPDGRWITYVTAPSGHKEVYVRRFLVPPSSPAPTALVVPVSRGVGAEPPKPRWRADGKELFYVGPNRTLMAVAITTNPSLRAGEPRALFQLPLGAEAWDVTPDGKRFLIAVPLAQSAPPPFTVVLNWQSLLRK